MSSFTARSWVRELLWEARGLDQEKFPTLPPSFVPPSPPSIFHKHPILRSVVVRGKKRRKNQAKDPYRSRIFHGNHEKAGLVCWEDVWSYTNTMRNGFTLVLDLIVNCFCKFLCLWQSFCASPAALWYHVNSERRPLAFLRHVSACSCLCRTTVTVHTCLTCSFHSFFIYSYCHFSFFCLLLCVRSISSQAWDISGNEHGCWIPTKGCRSLSNLWIWQLFIPKRQTAASRHPPLFFLLSIHCASAGLKGSLSVPTKSTE